MGSTRGNAWIMGGGVEEGGGVEGIVSHHIVIVAIKE